MGQRTQPNLKQLLQAVHLPAPPDVMERRRRALLEIAETLEPQDPLWTIVGVRCPATEVEYMAFLRRLCERSGLSYQQIASRTAANPTIESVPRSTVHGVLQRTQLPRREDQLRALLVVLIEANHGSGADLEGLLGVRAQLIASRAKVDTELPSGPTEDRPPVHCERDTVADEGVTCARCRHGRDPVEVARVAGLLLLAFAMVALTIIAMFRFVL